MGIGEIERAIALHRKGDIAAAEALYRQILESEPRHAEALHLLGVIALQRGDPASAETLIAQAVARDPARGEFQRNLGLAQMALDRLVEAGESLEKAAALDPGDVAALINLSALRLKQRAFEPAISAAERALSLDPSSLAAMTNLAMALRDAGRAAEAETCFRRALVLAPGSPRLEADLAALLRRRGEIDEAMLRLRRASAAAPADGDLRCTLYHESLRVAGWSGLADLGTDIDRLNDAALNAGHPAPESAFLNLLRSEDPAYNLRIARSHACETARRVAWAKSRLRRAEPTTSDGRIRIAYLTADIWDHPTAHLAAGLFAAHDRARFDVHLYSYGPDDGSDYRGRIARDVEHFIELRGLDTLAAAQRIAGDGIDILVDLKGHTMEAWLEILALRPAPIQIHWLGFPGSIGGDFLDYLIADPVVLPADQFSHYAEKILRLPRCYQVNDDRQAIGPAVTRKDAGLPEDAFVFCCFNHTHKIEPVMFDLWMKLLHETPNAILWLLGSSPLAELNLRAEAQKRGIAPARLIFAPQLPKAQHLARLALADLALDTRIYNGHTTSSDALWAGLPIVGLMGRHFASRVSASLLHTLGLGELVVESLEECHRLARALASDPARLAALRARLADARTTAPLFDTSRFTRNLERAYGAIWARHRNGLPPDHLDIAEAPSARDREQARAAFARGSAQRAAKEDDAAGKSFRRAVALDPDLADAAYNLGNILREAGRASEAAAAYRQALLAKPAHAAAAFNLGLALNGLGEIAGAAAAYRQAIEHAPSLVPAHINLSLALRDLGRTEDALAACRQALALDPASPLAIVNEALLLSDMGQGGEARERLEALIARAPDDADALSLLAGLLPRAEIDRAIELLERAARLRPDDAEIAAKLLYLLQQACRWDDMSALAPAVDRQTDAAIAQGRRSAETPFAAIVRTADPARHLAIARTWAAFYERQAARLAPTLPSAAAPGQRLRIAYLANSFRDHPIAQLMLGLYRRHDRKKFHVSAYSYGADDGSRHRRRIAAEVDRFTDIAGLGDAAAAARIRADGIDILIDLNGYIEGARLAIAALRPAPIQIAYLGYPGTTGARFFDYILADRMVAPAEHAAHFAEAICRLPHCYLATDDEQPIATGPLRRADCGLPPDGFVFCSFNQSYKIDVATFALWMRLLGRVRDSVLWLLRPNPAAERNLRAAGIGPARLIFAERLPKDRHLQRLGLADLALDTRIYNGHVSSVDALWAGVPLVAMRGRHFAARVTASLLEAIGLPELIAGDLAGYESLALALATDRPRLAALRARLADRRENSPLFNTTRFTRDLERALAEIWRRHLAGEPVRALDL